MKRIGLDITVLNNENLTGIGIYTYDLIKSLLQINQTDRFVLFGFSTFSTYDRLNSLEFKNYPNVEIKIIKIPAKLFRSVFLLWQKLNFPKVEDLIGNVDIFHSFHFYFPPQKSGKSVATIFDLTTVMSPQWHLRQIVQLNSIRFSRISNMADQVLSISKSGKEDFLKFYPHKNVDVIYPGVATKFEKKYPQGIIEKVLKKYNLKPGYILSVSTLEPRKNLKALINGYLKSQVAEKLVLVGDIGWKINDLIEDLNSLKNKNIQLTGYVDSKDLPIIYSQALCLVYPSFYEGFGIPVLESMAVGTPVICSKVSSLPEVGGKAVLYIDPKNEATIAEALVKLSKDSNLRKKLRTAGLDQAKKFSWAKSAQKLNNIYQNL